MRVFIFKSSENQLYLFVWFFFFTVFFFPCAWLQHPVWMVWRLLSRCKCCDPWMWDLVLYTCWFSPSAVCRVFMSKHTCVGCASICWDSCALSEVFPVNIRQMEDHCDRYRKGHSYLWQDWSLSLCTWYVLEDSVGQHLICKNNFVI